MNGAERIAAERTRQIEQEEWSPEHDDEHEDGEIALAAVCYAAPRPVYLKGRASRDFFDPWPWEQEWDKRPRDEDSGNLAEPTPEQRIRMLEKAGALIAAEIDRLLRAGDAGKDGGR